MWGEFRSTIEPGAELAGTFAFGDSPEMADELADLVLHGPKRATAGLLLEYERDGEQVPRPGEYSIVLSGLGAPVCVIRTTNVEVRPFDQVDDQFAWYEGEGDRSLAWWHTAHERFFRRQCESLGVPFDDELPVVLERFELCWPHPPAR